MCTDPLDQSVDRPAHAAQHQKGTLPRSGVLQQEDVMEEGIPKEDVVNPWAFWELNDLLLAVQVGVCFKRSFLLIEICNQTYHTAGDLHTAEDALR
jgi:hypothetical protein